MKMSSRVMGLVCGAMLLVAALPAVAQQDTPTRHIIFDDVLVDGDRLRPDGVVMQVRGPREFPPLFTVERSFLPAVAHAAEEKVLQ